MICYQTQLFVCFKVHIYLKRYRSFWTHTERERISTISFQRPALFSINQSIHRSWREEECKRGRGVFLIIMPPLQQRRTAIYRKRRRSRNRTGARVGHRVASNSIRRRRCPLCNFCDHHHVGEMLLLPRIYVKPQSVD